MVNNKNKNKNDIDDIDDIDDVFLDDISDIIYTGISDKLNDDPENNSDNKKTSQNMSRLIINNKDDNINKIINTDYSYPEIDDKEFQYKVYKKGEFYHYKIPEPPEIKNYDDLKQYRDNVCGRQFTLHEHQNMLSNFINPDTPYKGLVIFHWTGTGKTCAGIAIAEKFKAQVQKYNTKILILVPGPLIKENWKASLIKCTGETYMKYIDNSIYLTEQDKNKLKKDAINNAMQYYKFMSYRSFYKRVLGEKIVDKKVVKGSKVKSVYRKTTDGEFERDISIDRIYNLDNTLIIVDEAHNLTGNMYGDALKKIIDKSVNLRVILMTATPMKNFADDIVELVNFIRPKGDQIDKSKIFNNTKHYLMDFKQGGLDYLKKMMSGYVSHVRGADPLIFAKRNDIGEIPNGLVATKVIRCYMNDFQRELYDKVVLQNVNEAAVSETRRSEAVANFAFPCLNENNDGIIGCHGKEGINILKNQIITSQKLLGKEIAKKFKDIVSTSTKTSMTTINSDDTDLVYISQITKNITGKIFSADYLKYFSIKFYTTLMNLEELVAGKRGPQLAFIYSNLVRVGIELFQEVLLQNGYLIYQEDRSSYQINGDTKCYYCGYQYGVHNDYKYNNQIGEHEFYPATFISVTGKSSLDNDAMDTQQEEKKTIIDNVLNNINNKEGRYIKFILGSRVMNEGISLENIREIHILDVYYNFGRVDQVVGRGIRFCSHYKSMNKNNIYPDVKIYKYVVSLDKNNNMLSSEEELYKKAEYKYFLVKKVERAMKEIAIDCPLNIYGNMFKQEINEYKGCKTLDEIQYKTNELSKQSKNNNLCPLICDYTTCNYKCDDIKLNYEYYDPSRMIYKKIQKEDIDYSTFTQELSRNEIEYAKNKIKNLYIFNTLYTLGDIIRYVKKSYKDDNRDLFDEFFIYKALDELIPITENDFNNFKDTILDKNNRSGYLIHVDRYYIFQPYNQNDNVPMYYRNNYIAPIQQSLSLYNYLLNTTNIEEDEIIFEGKQYEYNFADAMDYYNDRPEFTYVGIIDKETSNKKSKDIRLLKDMFKIREQRAKILDKKRGTGIPSIKGAVCYSSKSKEYLGNIAKYLNVDISHVETRQDICSIIRDKMLFLEKYSLGKDKMTYIMIPINHPDYKFPYNLEDRCDYVINDIKEHIKVKLDFKINKIDLKDKTFKYLITINDPKNILSQSQNIIDKYNIYKDTNTSDKKKLQELYINIE